MDRSGELLLDALRCAVHGEKVEWTAPIEASELNRLIRLAREHSVFPMLAEATASSPAVSSHQHIRKTMAAQAKRLTIAQANHTAEFMLVIDALEEKGLRPAVLKGIILRSLYPKSEQRASTDEDLQVKPEELPLYRKALEEYGLTSLKNDLPDDALEATYVDPSRGLYIEVHAEYFLGSSTAYGDCNRLLDGALDRLTEHPVYGRRLRTLSPTDHLLFMLLHAYKHFLHGGVGIRQVMDINLFAERFHDEIDWRSLIGSAESANITHFAATLFVIGEKWLGFPHNAEFESFAMDEGPLLDDILSGGLYGVTDINRLHSSTMTLDAVASGRGGKSSTGVLHSVFLPLNEMRGRYPYLYRHGWLLPAAWIQRIVGYIAGREKRTDPAESVRIGKDRVALLRKYGIIK